MRPNNFELGRKAEDSVLEEYLEKGFTLLAKNFEVYSKDSRGRRAEIDLIMFKNNIVHIVEVKARRTSKYGDIASQVTFQKLKHLQFAYQVFISKNPLYKQYNAQIDIALVKSQNPIEIIFNAVHF